MTDHDYMARALELAQRGFYTVRQNPCVGCVMVKDNKIIAEGWHQRAGDMHAEIHALMQAGDAAVGATCFITLEPCSHFGKTPPCTSALINAHVQRVVIATRDPNPQVCGNGIAELQAAGITVEVGLLATEAQAMNAGFFQRMQTQRPYVRVKLAMSLDGKTALANGKSQWITHEAARQDVQKWRARSGAVLTSSQTVIMDNPQLNVRDLVDEQFTPPLRVVIDTHLRTTPSAHIYKVPEEVVVVKGDATALTSEWKNSALNVISLPVKNNHVDLSAVMDWLAAQQINDVWVEAGAHFAGALAQAGLVDEWIIYIAPKFLGPQAQPLLQLPELTELSQAMELEFMDCEKIGKDLRVVVRNEKGVKT